MGHLHACRVGTGSQTVLYRTGTGYDLGRPPRTGPRRVVLGRAEAAYCKPNPHPSVGRTVGSMQPSTIAMALGAVLFVLPVPGTFVAGAAVFLLGALGRWLGF